MIKTETIKISNQVFHIDQDGYNLLERYLKEIQTYFSKYEDSEEIVSDIENSIADKLNRRRNNQNDVIHANAVKEVIDSVGSVSEIAKALKDEEVNEVTLWNRLKSFNRTAGRKIINTIKKIGRPAKFIIGLFLSLGFGAAFIGLTIALITVLFNLDSPLIDEGIKKIFFDGSLNYYFVLVYSGLIVPTIVFFIWGLSLVFRRNLMPQSLSIGLIAIWILIVIAIGGTSFKVFGDVYQRIKVNPGVITSTDRIIDLEEDIKVVRIGNSNETISAVNIVEATDGDEKIIVNALNSNFNKYNFKVANGELVIELNQAGFDDRCLLCDEYGTTGITIYVNDLNLLDLDYSPRTAVHNSLAQTAEIRMKGGYDDTRIYSSKYQDQNLKINAFYSSIYVDGVYKNLDLILTNGSHAILDGNYETVKADLNDASYLAATNVSIQELAEKQINEEQGNYMNGFVMDTTRSNINNLELNIANQSYAEVTTLVTLKANLLNRSNLRYDFKGEPEITKDETSTTMTFEEAIKEEIKMQYGPSYLDDVVIEENGETVVSPVDQF